jgi:1-acyl-sn-glycerol-3-phosphate acyltransferase
VRALHDIYFAACQVACWAVCLVLFRYRVLRLARLPRTGPVLLAVNHQSYVDPMLAGSALPRPLHFMARRTLFVGTFGRLIRSVNAFPVDRDRADLQAVREAIGLLERGRCLLIFPEGTRSRDGRLAPMRSGFGMLARRTGAPIVPVYIDGAFRAWPRQRLLPRLRQIRVWFGEPIRVARDEDELSIVKRVGDALHALEREADESRR